MLYQVKFGASLKAVGDGPALGTWDVNKGASLNWSEGHVWSVTLDLPLGEKARFKVPLFVNPTYSVLIPDDTSDSKAGNGYGELKRMGARTGQGNSGAVDEVL